MFACSQKYSDPEYIPRIWVCDGKEECQSGEDETDCGEIPDNEV